MLLQSIKLENFRQFKDEYIEFSTIKFKNVTIIFGENGTGKTTFAQAFFWCLYGEADFSDRNNLLNKSVEIDMIPGQDKKVEVQLKLKHGVNEYTIRRYQYYKKTNNRLTADNSVLSVTRKSQDGETKALKKNPETEIRKILPKELARYFFFDGDEDRAMSTNEIIELDSEQLLPEHQGLPVKILMICEEGDAERMEKIKESPRFHCFLL